MENIKIQARACYLEASQLARDATNNYKNSVTEVESIEPKSQNIKSYELEDKSFEDQAQEAYEKAKQTLEEARTTGKVCLERLKKAIEDAGKAINADDVNEAQTAKNTALDALNEAKPFFNNVVDKLKIVTDKCTQIRSLEYDAIFKAVQMKNVFLTQAQTEIKDAQTSRGEIKDKVDKMEEKRTKCDEIINELKQQLDTVQKLVIPEGSNADVSNKKTECLTEISAQEDIVNYEKN